MIAAIPLKRGGTKHDRNECDVGVVHGLKHDVFFVAFKVGVYYEFFDGFLRGRRKDEVGL